MDLTPESIELRFNRAAPDLRDDVFRFRHALAQSHSDRIADFRGNVRDGGETAFAGDLADPPEVGTQIIGPLQVGLELPAAEFVERERFQHGRITDPEPQLTHDESRDVFGFLRRDHREQIREITQLLLDRSCAAGARDRQCGRPAALRRSARDHRWS